MSVNKTQQTVKSSQHLTGATFVGVVFYFAHILQQAFAKDATLSNDAIFNSSATMVSEDNEVTDTNMVSINGLKSVQAESSSLQSTEPTLVGSFSETTTASFSVDQHLGAVDAQDEEESPVEPNTLSFSLPLITTLAGGTTLLAIGNSNDDDAATDNAGSLVQGYSYQMDLSMSFTGEDSLDISLDAGATDDAASALDAGDDATGVSSSETPELQVDGVTYTFPLGAASVLVDSAIDSGDAVALEQGYDFQMDLSTSFTGEDSLDIALDAGGSVPAEFDAASSLDAGDDATVASSSETSELQVDGVTITFPLGDFSYPDFHDTGDVSNGYVYTGACAYNGPVIDACGTTFNESGVDGVDGGGSFSLAIPVDTSSQAPEEGLYVFPLAELSLEDGSTQELVLTHDSDGYNLSIGIFDKFSHEPPGDDGYSAAIEGVAISLASQENDPYVTTLQGFQLLSEAIPLSWVPDSTEALESQGYELGESISEVGIGTLYQVIRPAGLEEGESELEDYESFYAYPVNDGMAITPAVFSVETQDDDSFGAVVTTTFEF